MQNMDTHRTAPPLVDCLTTGPAATYAGISQRTLHRYAELGRLTKYYVGGRLRWHKAELDALVTTPEQVSA